MKGPDMYQTVVKMPGGDIFITYCQKRMTAQERKTLIKYGVKVVTHKKLK